MPSRWVQIQVGLVFWVSRLVFWVSGLLFWVSGFVFWVSGICLFQRNFAAASWPEQAIWFPSRITGMLSVCKPGGLLELPMRSEVALWTLSMVSPG